jgi:nicotinamide-nucleotide amidase
VGRLRGRTLALLPGVPAELAGLLPHVIDRLEAQGVLPDPLPARLWRTAQAAELRLVSMCREIVDAHEDLRWSWWLTDWGVDVRLADPEHGGDSARLDAAAAELDTVLGHLVTSRSPEDLPETVMKMMVEKGRTLAVAESCTAGMIGGALTGPAGSSSYFRGGILAYADEVKRDLLGVPAGDIKEHGAVSEPVVRAMAAGCRERLGTDYGLAVSGISGPGGAVEGKPVGTTWVGVATPSGVFAHCYRFPGDRQRNRLLTVAAAVDSIRRVLEFGDENSPWRPEDDWCRPR